MANQITDNRTLINNADAVTNWTDVSGVGAGTLDNDTFTQGTGSVTFNLTSAVQGLIYNIGSTVDMSGNHLYVWFNCAIAGKLDTLAGGGVRIRFAGPTITNYFEVFVAGSDTYTGGWKMFVVDVSDAAANPDATGGTPPAATAIQRVGVVGDTNGFMSKKADNFWVDAIWRLPASTPGIIVEGLDAGISDWTWDDILTTAVAGGWGTCVRGPGGSFVVNTPIRFGTNDASTHGFSDTDKIILWDDQPVSSTLYGFDIIGGSGAQSFRLGAKTGTGDTATGGQGCVIAAISTGQRWYIDSDDANVDASQFYGCTFIHGGNFQLDNANVETISCSFTDCSSARVDNSLFQRNNIVDANTADGVAFLTTDDLTDVKFCSFNFSDGHAVELTTPRVATQANKGNKFTGYGADGTNDAAIYNNTAGAVTINVTDSGDSPTIRNGASASTTINNAVNLTITCVDENSDPVQNVRVAIYRQDNGVELMNELTDVNGIATETFNFLGNVDIDLEVRSSSGSIPFIPVSTVGQITTDGFTLQVVLQEDNFIN